MNGKQPDAPGGLFGEVRDSDFPSELIKANANFGAALSNCYIRDEPQRNSIILYAAQLNMFGLVDELSDLTNFLNGSVSIGGYSRVLAASSHIGMLHPSALGVKLSKEGEKAWAEASMDHKRRRDGRDGDGQEKED